MNRYEQTIVQCRARGEIAFIPFAVAGDPDLKTSEAIFKTYIDAGADILEIGYPFSDPVADGPVNQRGAIRALNSGFNHDRFFSLVKTVRSYTDIPFGLLCYANSIAHIGAEEFSRRSADSGLDSILVADMPPEEAGELLPALKKHGLRSVFIVSELTPKDRIVYICKKTTGFVYVVSRLGVTGTQSSLDISVKATLQKISRVTKMPLCVGFGISKPEHVTQVKKAGADGAIVGSALVSIIEKNLSDKSAMLKKLRIAVKSYKAAAR